MDTIIEKAGNDGSLRGKFVVSHTERYETSNKRYLDMLQDLGVDHIGY